MKKLINFLGWVGVVLIIFAYAMNAFGFFQSKDVIYLILNALGSIFIITHAFSRHDYQPVILNIIWALVAFVNLVVVLK